MPVCVYIIQCRMLTCTHTNNRLSALYIYGLAHTERYAKEICVHLRAWFWRIATTQAHHRSITELFCHGTKAEFRALHQASPRAHLEHKVDNDWQEWPLISRNRQTCRRSVYTSLWSSAALSRLGERSEKKTWVISQDERTLLQSLPESPGTPR